MANYNGASTGAVSGAAQGAVTGFQFGGPWGAAAGAGIGLLSGYFSGKANDAQAKNQDAWKQYNAKMQYQTDLFNIKNQYALSAVNAVALLSAAASSASAATNQAEYNAAMIFGTTQYNQQLMEIDLTRVWEDQDLELEQLETMRLRERGGILANQAASGTVIDEGSNLDVIVDQTTQRAMDANIIMFGADRKAADIQNSMAKSSWEGQVGIQQTIYEGKLSAWSTMASAQAQAGAIMGSAALQRFSDTYSAKQQQWSTQIGIAQDHAAYNKQNTQAMTSGLFSAASSGVSQYYGAKGFGGNSPQGSSSATKYTNFKYMGSNSQIAALPRNIQRTPQGSSLAGGLN